MLEKKTPAMANKGASFVSFLKTLRSVVGVFHLHNTKKREKRKQRDFPGRFLRIVGGRLHLSPSTYISISASRGGRGGEEITIYPPRVKGERRKKRGGKRQKLNTSGRNFGRLRLLLLIRPLPL